MENSIKNLLTTKNAENAEKTAPLFPFLNIFCALSTGRKNPIKTLITAESVESAEEVCLYLLSSVFSHGSQSNFCKFVRLSESKLQTSNKSSWAKRKGPRAVALAVQLPENLRFSVIPKRNSGSETRGAKRVKRTAYCRVVTPLANSDF